MPDSKPRSTTKTKTATVPVLLAVAAALIALGAALVPVLGASDGGQADSDPAAAEPTSSGGSGRAPDETWQQLVRREPADPMARGDVDAPVVMIAYSEFQCPFCGKFARDTEPALVEEYVQDGTLRIEWRDFPYLGEESLVAARGGRAAARQDMFWEFQEAMYADQLPPNSGRLDEAYLVSVAQESGLDVAQFREDLDRADLDRGVQQDFAEGQAIGVTGTPTFVVNGMPLVGAQPLEAFRQTIEEAATEAGS